jgi:site-specific recombinase XerD
VTWDEFFQRLSASRRLSPASLTNYRACWRYFLAQWPNLKGPQDVTERHLTDFYRTQLRTETVSNNTAGGRLRGLLVVLAWAQRQGHLLVNPGQSLRVRKPSRPIPRILTTDEVELLLQAPLHCNRFFIRYRDRALLELFYGTGMRAGDVLALDLSDLDLAEALLQIRGGKGQPRFLPLGSEVVAALGRYLKEARPAVALEGETAVFVSMRGSRLTHSNMNSQLSRYGKDLGIEGVTPHAFRRAVATHMLENGASLPEIKALLGHEDISSTQFYAQVVPVEMLREHRCYHPRAYRRRKGARREN